MALSLSSSSMITRFRFLAPAFALCAGGDSELPDLSLWAGDTYLSDAQQHCVMPVKSISSTTCVAEASDAVADASDCIEAFDGRRAAFFGASIQC